jgi:hypothetical protein
VRCRRGVGPLGLALVAIAEGNVELQRRRAARAARAEDRDPREVAPAPPSVS